MSTTCVPYSIIIFGASGDLTWRKLIPALYNNFKKGRLSECSNIIGYARRPYSNEDFRAHLKEGVSTFSPETFDQTSWDTFSGIITYFKGDLDVAEDFQRLETTLQGMEHGEANRLYYLATAPEHYELCAENLGKAGMAAQEGCWRRLIVEKPFGTDLASAQALNKAIHNYFEESQVYRIDHYLGKETAQNVLFFRFANLIFEPIWNRRYVDNIQITVAEEVDVGHRAGYYDTAGVVRDMFQNHLLQLLALVAMEPPSSFHADAVRNEKTKVFESIRSIQLEEAVRGQYEGYCDSEGVAANSQTPTFAAIKLNIDNWRWKGVPFYLRSGKAMAQKTSEIVIVFQRPPFLMFQLPDASKFVPNILSLCIQPDEGIHLRFEAKLPDTEQEMRSVDMDFHYQTSFNVNLPDAYERLLLDALMGDASLFTRSDAIEVSWRLIDPLLQAWEQDGNGTGNPISPLHTYARGSWGPDAGVALLARDGKTWRKGCQDIEGTIHA